VSGGPGRWRAAAGIALVAVGMAGTLLPVIPGVPLIVAGMAVLGPEHPWSRAVAGRLRRWRARGKERA
jgi:hypothetical protein